MPCYICGHCNKCGMYSTKLEITCGKCGEPVAPGANTCTKCGAPLAGNTVTGKYTRPGMEVEFSEIVEKAQSGTAYGAAFS